MTSFDHPSPTLSTGVQDPVLAMLHRLESTNQDIVRRMEALERRDSVSSTPVTCPKASLSNQDPVYKLPQPSKHINDLHQSTSHMGPTLQATTATSSEVFKAMQQGVVLSLDSIRQAPNVAASVNQLLLPVVR